MPADLVGLTPTAANLLLREVLPGHRVAACVLRTGGQLSQVYEAYGYTVMTLLPGQPLSAVSARLGESEIFGVYRQMGSILAALPAT
ncbi:MAG: hypothetical protein ACLP8X_19310 [Streptosporangiaceae bacterium]